MNSLIHSDAFRRNPGGANVMPEEQDGGEDSEFLVSTRMFGCSDYHGERHCVNAHLAEWVSVGCIVVAVDCGLLALWILVAATHTGRMSSWKWVADGIAELVVVACGIRAAIAADERARTGP